MESPGPSHYTSHAGFFWSSILSFGGSIWATVAHGQIDMASLPPVCIAVGSLLAAIASFRKMQEETTHRGRMNALEAQAKAQAIEFERQTNVIRLQEMAGSVIQTHTPHPAAVVTSPAAPAPDPARPTPEAPAPSLQECVLFTLPRPTPEPAAP